MSDTLIGTTRYRLLTVTEAARQLGVSRETVRRWINRGVIRAVRVGKNHKIPEVELMRLVGNEAERATE
jgi:excisionase family DNA binding protein